MRFSSWRPLLFLIAGAVLIVHEETVSTPSCVTIRSGAGVDESEVDDPEDLKVMLVANLLLLGPEGGYLNAYFRDYYMSKFFRKSFGSLKPDMLLVLGDVSAKGYSLTKGEWLSVLQQFKRILGPFLDLPFLVILGDRDIGDCSGLDQRFVYWITRKFPGLDSAGCAAFDISNISFISLNSVSLLCGKNDLRFSIEKVIERESIGVQMKNEGRERVITNDSSMLKKTSCNSAWRENFMPSGSGPVLLHHFPLHRTTTDKCRGSTDLKESSYASHESSKKLKRRGLVGVGPYERSRSLPLNETQYIFQALRPRIVFSAHTHEFCDYTHTDGTREVTVPAMTWDAKDEPGFVVATFRRNRKAISVSQCSLVRESHVLATLVSIWLLLMLMALVINPLYPASYRR